MHQNFMFILDWRNIKTLGILGTLDHFRHLTGYYINRVMPGTETQKCAKIQA